MITSTHHHRRRIKVRHIGVQRINVILIAETIFATSKQDFRAECSNTYVQNNNDRQTTFRPSPCSANLTHHRSWLRERPCSQKSHLIAIIDIDDVARTESRTLTTAERLATSKNSVVLN